MKVLVINCGSSSIKYQFFEMPEEKILARGLLEKIGEKNSRLTHQARGIKKKINQDVANHRQGLELIISTLTDKEAGAISEVGEIEAIGHRVVHGGEGFPKSVLITEEVIRVIRDYCRLAPLHNPSNLAGIKAAANIIPQAPQVAAFDTAFHQTIPQVAYLYAIPLRYYEKYKIRRYGFHGISHRFVARRTAELLKRPKSAVNVITCHLGNGCSIAAVRNGRSVDTSMGMTPLEGLVMGTRAGDIDPAIIFYLQERGGMRPEEIDVLLNKKSGLLGISGVSNDVRTLLQEAASGNEKAKLALDVFCYRIKKYIGAYSAVLGRVDAVVFTGGIGENAVDIRYQVCDNLRNIGIKIDKSKNREAVRKECLISSEDSKVKVFVIPTDEEVRIAYDTYELTAKGARALFNSRGAN